MKTKPDENTAALTVENQKEPIAAEIIADSIVKIAEGMKALSSTRLTKKSIVTLIQARTKLSRKHIELVMENLQDLERNWLKPK